MLIGCKLLSTLSCKTTPNKIVLHSLIYSVSNFLSCSLSKGKTNVTPRIRRLQFFIHNVSIRITYFVLMSKERWKSPDWQVNHKQGNGICLHLHLESFIKRKQKMRNMHCLCDWSCERRFSDNDIYSCLPQFKPSMIKNIFRACLRIVLLCFS